MMELRKYDGQCVRIIDRNGDAFDGICNYNNEDYDEHEFGRAEESLEIENFLFYRSDIQTIKSLENRNGLYGRFLNPYGKLEELTVEDGIDSIREVLFSEEKEHVCRLLRCLDNHLGGLSCRAEVIEALKELASTAEDTELKDSALRLAKRWK